MKTTHIIFSTLVLSGTIIFSSCSSKASEQETVKAQVTQQDPKAEDICSNWPEVSKKAAQNMIEKYGQPDEMTESRFIWNNNGPWKQTIVYQEQVPHHFPKKHVDVLEQTIDYKLPTSKYDDITEYDGSVFAERTKGELSARCDMEEANFLAINLAHDIATGKKNVKTAREEYARAIAAFMDGNKPDIMKGINFTLPEGNQRDPGEAIMDQVMAKDKKQAQ